MSKFIQNMLSRFNYNSKMYQFQDMMRKLRAAQRVPRSETHKPAFSMGYRGAPRKMTPNGNIPAPTIDQVRKLERAYMCKLSVKRGVMYFRGTDIAFTHDRGKEHRHAVMEEKVNECA
jgi:hypothetical protein